MPTHTSNPELRLIEHNDVISFNCRGKSCVRFLAQSCGDCTMRGIKKSLSGEKGTGPCRRPRTPSFRATALMDSNVFGLLDKWHLSTEMSSNAVEINGDQSTFPCSTCACSSERCDARHAFEVGSRFCHCKTKLHAARSRLFIITNPFLLVELCCC